MIIQKWKQCGTCVQGIDHKAAGVVCQDGVASAAQNGVYAIALSDGGGSRKYSEIGSACSTRAICEYLVGHFDALYAKEEQVALGGPGAERMRLRVRFELIDVVLAAMRREVTGDRSLQDFGCTLQFAAVKDGRYIVGHIGDGVIAAVYQRGLSRSVRVLSHPENGGGPNITFFITDHDAIEHLRIQHGECRQLEGILMMSDGPEEVLYHAQMGMHPNTMKLFDNFVGITRDRYEASLTHFLSKTVAGRSFDDLSLNLLYLETIDAAKASDEYREELFAGVSGKGQVRRVGANTYFVDPCKEAGAGIDLSSLRS